jgi:hypothetical protein
MYLFVCWVRLRGFRPHKSYVPIGYLPATWKALAKVVTEKLFSSPITTCIKRLK